VRVERGMREIMAVVSLVSRSVARNSDSQSLMMYDGSDSVVYRLAVRS
jgi:hypothetical protein